MGRHGVILLYKMPSLEMGILMMDAYPVPAQAALDALAFKTILSR
jgi:hypothetical protein